MYWKLQASSNINSLEHVSSIIKGVDGEKGYNKDCNGKSAQHTIVPVSVSLKMFTFYEI